MPKSENQKVKLLYIIKYLHEKTDAEHPVSFTEIAEELAKNDIAVSVQTLYDDIEFLRKYGYRIEKTGTKEKKYYLAERMFTTAEIKLLVDSVQSSKFITQEQTRTLIGKLEKLCCENDAKSLQRQVYVQNKIKSGNASVFENVDVLSDAINSNRAVCYHYFHYTREKKKEYGHGGENYLVSPYALMVDSENYYLLAWEHASGQFRHYRVDKMENIEITQESRQGRESYEKIDMSAYNKRLFSMFGGEVKTVRLRFANHLAGAVIDVFGKDMIMAPDGGDHFTVQAEIVPSEHFLGWVFAMGEDAEILFPQEVREQMSDKLRKTAEKYQ